MKIVLAFLGFALVSANSFPQGEICPCTREYAPVCGSDGQTYPNKCTLQCKSKQEPSLKVVGIGECGESHKKLPLCACPKNLDPVCGSDGVTYDNPCLLECEVENKPGLHMARMGECSDNSEKDSACFCNRMLLPVCGSDGKTYNNPCLLNCQKKTINPALNMVHYGACHEYLEEERVCPCTKIYLPVCGSDGRTYSNPCLLNCQKKVNPAIEVVHYGACSQLLTKTESPRKPCICNRMYIPVCGSDGKTYPSPCVLDCDAQEKPSLKMVHYGECVQQLLSKPSCPCPKIYMPVCGSDGKTYNSPCELHCQKKVDNGLEIVSHGACRQQLESVQMKDPICKCSKIYMPVCGSDGHTYPNPCSIACQKKVNSALEVEHFGECSPQMDSKPSCPCPKIYMPVCGSDGKSYNSPCELNCQKKVDNGLEIVSYGACRQHLEVNNICRCPKIYMPVCGTDGVTYPNECNLNCEARNVKGLEAAHKGPCRAAIPYSVPKVQHACPCPMIFMPVCGTDGTTYPNECSLNCKAKQVKGLSVAYEGSCRASIPY